MSDITQADICRYYGGSKKVNGLEPVDGRKSAQDALPALRSTLRQKLKTEPAEHRPFIRNVIVTLDIMLGKRPADEREAARKQTLRNIDHLERARAAQSADVA